MIRYAISVISLLILCSINANAQRIGPSFGKGVLNLKSVDSTFSMKIGIRFQNLATSTWTLDESENSSTPDLNFLIRRSRLKFNGFAFTKDLTYKLELGLSNRDISGGGNSDYSNAPRIILDAYMKYRFHKNWSVLFGQTKLPGNRERVISSGNLQFVDRSRLNSRFNIDRDFGGRLIYNGTFGNNFLVQQDFSISQGEGRNITSGNQGGLDYTYRLEVEPFGKFQSKGDYIGSAIKRESKPKLSVGVTYDVNVGAPRERGQGGSFIPYPADVEAKTLQTLFIDLMFKYQDLSIMAEYANKVTADGEPQVFVGETLLGTYYTGSAINLQAGYFVTKKNEIAVRYTQINPQEVVDQNETRYTLGFSRFVVGHKLKIQTDITYRDRETSSDEVFYRFQTDIHF